MNEMANTAHVIQTREWRRGAAGYGRFVMEKSLNGDLAGSLGQFSGRKTTISLMKIGGREEPSWTGGAPWIHLPMDRDAHLSRHHIRTEVIHQLLQSGELSGGRMSLFKITDQADTNADLINLFSMHMPTFDLSEPSGADFDLAIFGIHSVPYDEMVGQSILHPSLTVSSVVDGSISKTNGAVMNHDPSPSGGRNDERLGGFPHVPCEAQRWRLPT